MAETMLFFRARISIALIKTAHKCIRGSRVPVGSISYPWEHWEDGMGIKMFSYLEEIEDEGRK